VSEYVSKYISSSTLVIPLVLKTHPFRHASTTQTPIFYDTASCNICEYFSFKETEICLQFYLCEISGAEDSSLLKCKAFHNSEELMFICYTWLSKHTTISFSPKY